MSRLVPTACQLAAIEAPLGPVLVVAGPGAGKTFCLIERIRFLIERQEMAPGRICAVTFTNKAAEEIAQRLEETLGERAEAVTRGTLHALCAALLRQHGGALRLRPAFGIADEDYQRQVLYRLGIEERRWSQLLTLFGRRRLQDYALTEGDEQIFLRYRAFLAARDLLDFDDLVARVAMLLADHPEARSAMVSRWDYLLVDEFQDLNPRQYEIVQALAGAQRNIFAVGDDEQSIFSWAGADPRVLTRFASAFGISRPMILDENHRTPREVFEVARRLVGRNPALFEKEIRAPRASGQEVVVAGFANEKEEAQWLIADLRREREGTERPWGDFAILYRRHEVGNALESALVAAGIPCRLARGHALQDDPVVRFVLAALRLIVSPDDPVAIERFVELALGDANLMGRLRASAGGGGALLPAMQRQARGLPRGAPERRALWRTIYGLENLAGLAARHTELPDLVDEMLSRRVGPHQTPLEERQDELADPASLPEVVALAEDLSGAMHGRRQVWVNPASGLEIALRGMLFEAGITTVDYLADGREPGPGDLVLTSETRPGPPYVLRLFKALQLVHSRQAGGGLTEFVAFDLETTGHDPDTCEIVEIAAVRVQDGFIVDELHSLIRPRVGVSLRAREVHGYDDADLADAPRFEAVWPRFRAFVGDSVLVAHNGYQFDVPVLLRLARGLEGAGDLTFFDTLPLARAVQTGNAKLESLADRFGISAGRSHHALDDARTLALVHGQLEQARRTIARKTTLSNLLDFLALGLALEGRERFDQEAERIFDPARFYALGPYSECLSYYEQERQFAPGPTLEPVELIARLGGQQLLERLRVERSARDRYPETLARLRPFLEAAQGGCLVERIGHFLERVALATSDGVETDRQRVNLLTLHSTKGLEFPGVYIVGVEDRQLPGKRVLEEQREDELEEARRLLYVGMTRARARLVLTHVAERNGWRWGGTMLLEEMGLSSGSPPPERPPPRGDPMLHPRV